MLIQNNFYKYCPFKKSIIYFWIRMFLACMYYFNLHACTLVIRPGSDDATVAVPVVVSIRTGHDCLDHINP